MNFEIIKENQNHTQSWSGGSTTEIFIYPKIANFKKLDFDFRLSKATIEIDESEFTNLTDKNRILVLLEGELDLIHENHHQKHLKPYDFDSFKGDWKTKSKGIASDFNLIYSNKLKANLSVIQKNSNKLNFKLSSKNIHCLFVLEDKISLGNKNIHKNELLVIYPPFIEVEALKFNENAVFIFIEIEY